MFKFNTNTIAHILCYTVEDSELVLNSIRDCIVVLFQSFSEKFCQRFAAFTDGQFRPAAIQSLKQDASFTNDVARNVPAGAALALRWQLDSFFDG